MSPSQTADTRVYRGRTLDEVLPRIRDELGPDAVVVAQREGLAGGVGGFFQHPFVEVEARPGDATPRLDVRDDEALEPVAFVPDAAEGLQAPAIRELLAQAAPFAAQLEAAAAAPATPPEPPAAEPPAPVPASDPLPLAALRVEERLVAAGLPAPLAASVVAETVSHTVPFGTPRQMKRLVRAALARRIAVAPSCRSSRRTLAVVGAGGAGKTLSIVRLAAAYAGGSDLPVTVVALGGGGAARLAERLAPHGLRVRVADDAAAARRHLRAIGERGLGVLDTPAVSPADREGIAELGDALRALRLDEVHLALPAPLSRPAAEELVEALAPLRVSHLLLTHTDETAHVGPVVGLAIERGLPFSYVGRGADAPGGMLPADALDLAARVLP